MGVDSIITTLGVIVLIAILVMFFFPMFCLRPLSNWWKKRKFHLFKLEEKPREEINSALIEQ